MTTFKAGDFISFTKYPPYAMDLFEEIGVILGAASGFCRGEWEVALRWKDDPDRPVAKLGFIARELHSGVMPEADSDL
ncbi:hypothetical protein DEDE109153_14015 [Deinococcus deserti]|uniref:hypothetical protein n=1 Tax=Deinococcus deserti TaxID=310783 RepID=UPI00059E25EF|nr:hypothetical protein [Deinococcus deserti]